mgnify:CR=1 FL=1|tara:strand:+ start:4937 stop:5413 length:477 start_codon:yes stop_codon:yes gene_type:complete
MELNIPENIKKKEGKNEEIKHIFTEKTENIDTQNVEYIILKILRLSGFVLENIEMLNGISIPRELLISEEKYKSVSEYLEKLKKLKSYSSSTLTSLHSDAFIKQKWPLLNLIRQILKVENYRMKPYRKTDGKDKDGKKKYIRFFLIEKMKAIEENELE